MIERVFACVRRWVGFVFIYYIYGVFSVGSCLVVFVLFLLLGWGF